MLPGLKVASDFDLETIVAQELNMNSSESAVSNGPLSVLDHETKAKRRERNRTKPAEILKKTIIALLFLVVGNPLSLLVFGIINRILFRPIDTAFVCYAANESYREKYWFKFALPIISAFPAIVGFYFQGGKMGLIFVISSVEKDFRNADRLAQLMKNVNLVKVLLGVKAFHYSGILPTELSKKSLVSNDYLQDRCDMVAKVVLAAETQVLEQQHIIGYLPVIIIGGNGNVGKKIAEGLHRSGRIYFVVEKQEDFPHHLKNQPCLVIDVARKGALEQYLGKFWAEMIFLNETYPEPEMATLQRLKALGVASYHVTGVKARAYPKFPKSYAGGVPCCALINDSSLEALIKRL